MKRLLILYIIISFGFSFSTILAEVDNAGSYYNLELGFDSIILNLFDGTIETLYRPDDWNYNDYDQNESNDNYNHNKPDWVQSDRSYIPWTVYTDNDAIYYLLELDKF